MEIVKFFADENNIKKLREFHEFLIKEKETHNYFLSELCDQLLSIILHMIDKNNSVLLDKYCQLNIKQRGRKFISDIESITTKKEEEEKITLIEEVFSDALHFMCEDGLNKSLNLEDIGSYNFSLKNLAKFSDSARIKIISALHVQPVYILRKMLQNEKFSSFIEFKNTIQDTKDFFKSIASKTEEIKNKAADELDKLKVDLDEKISEKEKRVEILRAELNKLSTGFNFVGLSQGFKQLATEKKKEKTFIFCSLVGLACLSLCVLGVEIGIIFFSENFNNNPQPFLYAALPTLAIEVLLIYYFRVVLFNFKSIKTQLIQLDLRETLCQFIEKYAEYAKEIKTNDSVALEKFENLIFSGLVAHDENLPSTFDGFEQIAKLVNSIKSK